VPYQWSVDTYEKLTSLGIPSQLTVFPGDVHVPFAEHGGEISGQTTRFLYKRLHLRDADRR
jgi:hypothetical protein